LESEKSWMASFPENNVRAFRGVATAADPGGVLVGGITPWYPDFPQKKVSK
jgi:hypothetical protein